MAQLSQLLSWPETAIFLPWDIWIVTWIAAALWSNRSIKGPGIGRELSYRIVTIAAFIFLLVIPSQDSQAYRHGSAGTDAFTARHWALPATAGWMMVVLTSLGVIFAWWARVHLGRLWSARITRKQSHRVIDTGPYALVRHPIYTGLILMACATAAEKGSILAVVGAVLFCVGFWMKARLEEKFLREELGADAYEHYAARVAMLVPLIF